jgi:hypothetical protein
VLNRTASALDGTVRSEALPHRAVVVDASDDSEVGTVDDLYSFPLSVPGYGARFLVLRRTS